MHLKTKYFIITIALILISNRDLKSQEITPPESCGKKSCACGQDLTPSGIMISHVHKKREFMFSYRFMNMNMKGIQSGLKKTTTDQVFAEYLMAPNTMQMNMHMLMGMYGISNKLTLMGMMNYCNISMDMLAYSSGGHNHTGIPGAVEGGSNSHTIQTSGISDCKVHLLYNILPAGNQQLIFSGGLSLPTGNFRLKGKANDMMYPNQRYPYSMQAGSGTWDFLPAINYLFAEGNATFGAQIASVLRTGYNKVGYKLGNEASLNVWYAHRWLNFLSSSARCEATVAGTIKGLDPSLYYYNEISSNPYNYGGKKVNLFVGSTFQIPTGILKNHRLSVEYGLPVYQNLNGIQMKTKNTLFLSWSWGF